MSNGLPGYDDWLDNYGNPGIDPEPEPLDELDSSGVTEQYENKEDEMTDPANPMQNLRWPLTEQIRVTQRGPDLYDVTRVNGGNCFELSVNVGPDGERHLFIDGEMRDLGDDFIAYVSLIDDYHEQGGGDNGKTITMNPFEADDADH